MVSPTKNITIPVKKKLHYFAGSSMVLLPKIMMAMCGLKSRGTALLEIKQDRTGKLYIKITPEPDSTEEDTTKNEYENIKEIDTTSQVEKKGKRVEHG